MTNPLFLSARNRLRSPTAEQVFASHPGVETATELVEWADILFFMERAHHASRT